MLWLAVGIALVLVLAVAMIVRHPKTDAEYREWRAAHEARLAARTARAERNPLPTVVALPPHAPTPQDDTGALHAG